MTTSARPSAAPSSRDDLTLWSDNEAQVDLLRFEYLAEQIASVTTMPGLLPVTVGVFGDWGSGKSTLLQLAATKLGDSEGVVTLHFNGWLFEGYEEAKTALLGSILDTLDARVSAMATPDEKAVGLIKRLKESIDWFRVAGWTLRAAPAVAAIASGDATIPTDPGVIAGSVAAGAATIDMDEAQKLLKAVPPTGDNPRATVLGFRHDFEELLKAANVKVLVVFIDDLDSCLPDTVIETLEAIKLFLFVPESAFVIGADERLIRQAVQNQFPGLAGRDRDISTDYLEKLIQVPIRVPPLTDREVESYMNLLFAERRLKPSDYERVCQVAANTFDFGELSFDLAKAHEVLGQAGVPQQLQADFSLTAAVVPVLAPGLVGNPRRAKRFLNSLVLRLSLGRRRGLDLDRRVLAKLMLLEYRRDVFFTELASQSSENDGRPSLLAEGEAAARTAAQPETPTAGEQPSVAAAARQRQQATSQNPGGEDNGAASASDISFAARNWLSDDWVARWLASEPALSTTDLRPYFFIAHEKVGAQSGVRSRLAGDAAAMVALLLGGGVSQLRALDRAPKLDSAEAGAVLATLAEQVRTSDTPRNPVLLVLTRFVEKRPEFLPQLISLCSGLADAKISTGLLPILADMAKGSPSETPVRELLGRWAKSTGALGAAAAATRKRLDAK